MMKNLRWALALLFALLAVPGFAAKPVANAPPTVSLTAPLGGASYLAPATINLSATAADSNGTIAKVDFYRGRTLIGTSTAAPYAATWSGVAAGSYSLTAKATDNEGATTTSAAVAITVTAPNNNVLVTSPANGATVYGNSLTVSGTFVGATDSTVLVDNGNSTRLATLSSNTYSAVVPLYLGANTLSVTVARSDKTSDKTSITVNGNLAPLLIFTAPGASAASAYAAPANIALAVDALSPGGSITNVSLYKNGGLLASLSTPPYQYNWTGVALGSYSITAIATDNNGQTGSTTLPITVSGPNIPPNVSLSAPANNASYTAPATITLSANASDSDGTVTLVEFLENGQVLGASNTAPYNLSGSIVVAGSYSFQARATDNRGGISTSAPVTITVNPPPPPTIPPTVSLTGPQANASYTAPASITLTATATDPDGSIAKVEFYAGNTLIGFSATAPYTATWPVTVADFGTYVLTAKAADNVGASTVSSPVTIKVGDGITYLHNDLAGNPIAATDSSGAIIWKENFQPYGERLNNAAAAAENRQWFHGKAVDADTGLSYFGARYYDAGLGRFMGVDPVGFDPGNLHSFNRYAYGNNNPYRFTDPDGRAAALLLRTGRMSYDIANLMGAAALGSKIGIGLYNLMHQESAGEAGGGKNGVATPPNTPDPASGSDPDRGDLTKAGRGQQKHGDRVGSAFDPARGTPQDKNAQGQSTVDSIVNSPDRVDKPNRHGGIDVLQGPGQRGARFGPDGKFTGFLEP